MLEFTQLKYELVGQVVSPALPALPLANVAVKASLLNAGAVVTTVADSAGRFRLSNLPDGNVALTDGATTLHARGLGPGRWQRLGEPAPRAGLPPLAWDVNRGAIALRFQA